MNIPEESNYVWQKATEDSTATASVTLTLEKNVTLEREQVTAIKNLVAFSTTNYDPERRDRRGNRPRAESYYCGTWKL